MIWCIMSMLLGALVFGAGIVFEKLVNAEAPVKKEKATNEVFDPKLYRQWENLLGYDGTEQEGIYDENR